MSFILTESKSKSCLYVLLCTCTTAFSFLLLRCSEMRLFKARFRSCLSRFCYQAFKTQNGGCNMVVRNTKKAYIPLKIGMQGFLRSQITILLSDFRNSQWRNQYGRSKFEESLELAEKSLDCSTGAFEVTDHDLAIRFFEIQNGGKKFERNIDFA